MSTDERAATSPTVTGWPVWHACVAATAMRSASTPLSGVSERTVQRVIEEEAVTTIDNAAERARREVGRPSTVEAFARCWCRP